jgi:hypothetical protein
LEDLKSAEQLVKKKQAQQEQLQQLVAAASASSASSSTSSVNAASAPATAEVTTPQERRPSWRLKVDANDKNKVSHCQRDRASCN